MKHIYKLCQRDINCVREIDAFQITQNIRGCYYDWPEWLRKAWNKEPGEWGSVFPADYPNSNGMDNLMARVMGIYIYIKWGDYLVLEHSENIVHYPQGVFDKSFERVL